MNVNRTRTEQKLSCQKKQPARLPLPSRLEPFALTAYESRKVWRRSARYFSEVRASIIWAVAHSHILVLILNILEHFRRCQVQVNTALSEMFRFIPVSLKRKSSAFVPNNKSSKKILDGSIFHKCSFLLYPI